MALHQHTPGQRARLLFKSRIGARPAALEPSAGAGGAAPAFGRGGRFGRHKSGLKRLEDKAVGRFRGGRGFRGLPSVRPRPACSA